VSNCIGEMIRRQLPSTTLCVVFNRNDHRVARIRQQLLMARNPTTELLNISWVGTFRLVGDMAV